LDQTLISLKIALLEIVEKSPPLPYQLQETSTRMVVFDVNLEVIGQILNSLTQ